MVGVFASVGSWILLTLFLTSESTSFVFASVLSSMFTLETPSDELEVILSIHFILLISLYILSDISESMSTGLVHGYIVVTMRVPSFTEGLDSFGIFKIATAPSTTSVSTTR